MIKALLSCLLLYATAAQAASGVPDAGTMLANLVANVPQLMKLVTAIAYVMGMWFIYQGIVGLKQFGEQRSMGVSHHETMKGPLILITVGTFLLYLPSSVQVGINTFWTNPNPYGYIDDTQDQWGTLIQDCYMLIQFIGTIAVIRGFVVLTHLSQQGQPGTFGKGLTYIISGILCINLFDFLNVVKVTLGIGT